MDIPPGLLFLAFVGFMVGMSYLGAWVAKQKGRPRYEGFILGGLMGPFGVIVEGLLPVIGHPR